MESSDNKQRGSLLAPFLLSLGAIVVVSGAVVESSLMLHARGRLFDGAENALLAAANQTEYFIADTLDESAVNDFAYQYYAKNMLDPAATSLDYTKIVENELIIHSTKTVPLFFLPLASKELSADLAASVSVIAGTVEGAAPLGMQWPAGGFTIGVSYTLKEGPGNGTSGNFNALDMDGGGGGSPEFEGDLTNGYEGSIQIDQVIPQQSGGMVSATVDAIQARLATPSTDDDILIIVITTSSWGPGSSGEIVASGFAAFLVTDVGEPGPPGPLDPGEIAGTFIKYKMEALPAEPGAPDYGIYTQPKLKFYSGS